ncbi:MAG: PEP-CTERM sorting domain-containing protein [Verrucomicrobiota bacterium]
MKTQLIVSLLGLLAPVAASAVSINIDFGGASTPASGWNNIFIDSTSGTPIDTPVAMLDSAGNATGIFFSYDDFSSEGGNFNPNGTTGPTGGAASLPSTVTQDSLFGHVSTFGLNSPVPVIHMTLSGLNAGELYQLSYFASRMSVGDVRTANYSLTNGNETSVAVLDASNNTSTIASSAVLAPSATGTLTLTITPDATNTNSSKFFYIGSLQIESMAATIPEPGSFAMLAGGAALGLVGLRRRR